MALQMCGAEQQKYRPTAEDLAWAEQFENQIVETVKKYDMITPEDKVIVAVSGGKDSTAVLYALKKSGYDVEAITVDAHIGCYTDNNLKNIRNVCKDLGVKLYEIPFRKVFGASLCHIRDTLQEKGYNYKSCNICGVLRRYLLNRFSREIGATKVVLGHNLDDEAQVILMNLVKNRQELNARLGPKPGVIRTEGFVPRIKPLYFKQEKEIVRYSKIRNFPVYYGKCPCSLDGFRNYIKEFLNSYQKTNPDVKKNIVMNFLEKVPMLRLKYKSSTVPNACNSCSEPSKEATCRACQLLDQFKSADFSLSKEAPSAARQSI